MPNQNTQHLDAVSSDSLIERWNRRKTLETNATHLFNERLSGYHMAGIRKGSGNYVQSFLTLLLLNVGIYFYLQIKHENCIIFYISNNVGGVIVVDIDL